MAEIIIPRRNRPRPVFAEFLPGPDFRAALLTADEDSYSVVSFTRARELPRNAAATVVSTPGSGAPIYAWRENQALYWYSEASVAYLNADASGMFNGFGLSGQECTISLRGISAARAEDMQGFFQNARITENPIPKNWDMRKVTKIADMYRGCTRIRSFEFAPRLTAALAGSNAGSLFMECFAAENIKVSCDLSGLTSLRNFFRGCVSLTSFDFTEADISAVTSAASMFEGCRALTAVDMQAAGFGGVRPVGESMFRTCEGLRRVKFQEYEATASLSFGASMFLNCAALTEVDFTRISVSGNGSLSAAERMFSGCSSLSVVYTADDFTGQANRDVFVECPIVGGAGTAFDPEHTDGEYARIDNRPTRPGYFTYKARE